MKPDIVFFGEGLPGEFHQAIESDRMQADLVIVMGSSLKVKPVAHIPNLVPPDIPQVKSDNKIYFFSDANKLYKEQSSNIVRNKLLSVNLNLILCLLHHNAIMYPITLKFTYLLQILINREPLPHLNFDVELLGDCDVVVNELCRALDWRSLASPRPTEEERHTCIPPARYLFSGAEIPDDMSQADSVSDGDSEEQSVVTTEDEDTTSENYVTQMRYAMGCDSRTYSENPGPSRISEERHRSRDCGQWEERGPSSHTSREREMSETRWDCDSVRSNASIAAQMGDSRQPSLDNVSVSSELEEQGLIMMMGEPSSSEDTLLTSSSAHPQTVISSELTSDTLTSSVEESAGSALQESVVVDSMS